MALGLSFMPMQGRDNGNGGEAAETPLQTAVKLLSLRFPSVSGARGGIAAPELLAGHPAHDALRRFLFGPVPTGNSAQAQSAFGSRAPGFTLENDPPAAPSGPGTGAGLPGGGMGWRTPGFTIGEPGSQAGGKYGPSRA